MTHEVLPEVPSKGPPRNVTRTSTKGHPLEVDFGRSWDDRSGRHGDPKEEHLSDVPGTNIYRFKIS